MDLNTKGIFISIFQLAEKGKLTKLEQKDVVNSLVSFGLNRLSQKMVDTDSETNIDEEFKRIRLGTRILLEQTEQCIDTALEVLKTQQDYFDKFKIDLRSLPEHAEFGDNTKTLAFIKSLKQDLYNFSEAEALTGVTRQTLKKHAEKELHGLKATVHGKSTLLSRERLIIYYRAKFKDDSLPF